MAHNAALARLTYQLPDGTNGTLDLHDEQAIHDEPESVAAENLAGESVINGKVAPESITTTELANGAVTKEKLSEEMQQSWDSISQETATLRNTIASVSTVANRADAKVYFVNKARKLSLNSWGSGMQIDSTQTDGKVLQLSADAGGLHFFVDGREVWSK